MVNNEELTSEQQIKGKEFLLTKATLFAQSIENLGRTNTITHSINTVLPGIRNDAVKRVKKVQESTKIRHDQELPPIEEFKRGDQVLVYKASQQYSKSHKLYPKWKGPFVVHKVLEKGVYKLRSVNGKIIKTL
ncbi:14067_t:CDS:2 [Dentiscutata erythropus]|uniref:14067_t:CDS:1 n=1 Tax=Dentiscutata erythropus TaxID=1348616 RepID=A0A9N8ZPI4_9GLOM|nr:14067_t:CDS:2 [Dentiscutata erythropus]